MNEVYFTFYQGVCVLGVGFFFGAVIGRATAMNAMMAQQLAQLRQGQSQPVDMQAMQALFTGRNQPQPPQG